MLTVTREKINFTEADNSTSKNEWTNQAEITHSFRGNCPRWGMELGVP
jgi:hypothetical protein